jgi:hypothetical protein
VTTEHTPRPGRTWDTALGRVETVVPDNAPDPQPNRAARRTTIQLVPTHRFVRVCLDCGEIDHPGRTCTSAAAARAAVRQLLGSASERTAQTSAADHGDPGPAFTGTPATEEIIRLRARRAEAELQIERGRLIYDAIRSVATRITRTDPAQEVLMHPTTLGLIRDAVDRTGRLPFPVGPIATFAEMPVFGDTSVPIGEVRVQPHPAEPRPI